MHFKIKTNLIISFSTCDPAWRLETITTPKSRLNLTFKLFMPHLSVHLSLFCLFENSITAKVAAATQQQHSSTSHCPPKKQWPWPSESTQSTIYNYNGLDTTRWTTKEPIARVCLRLADLAWHPGPRRQCIPKGPGSAFLNISQPSAHSQPVTCRRPTKIPVSSSTR